MIDVIMDQGLLRLADGLLYSVKLLCEIKAGPLLFNHLDHVAKMSLGAAQPGDDFRVRLMDVAV